jgi:hypothetical protein
MRPAENTQAWRKDGRRITRRDSEPCYWTPARMTRRQMGQALAAETAEVLARQAHIDQAGDPPLIFGVTMQDMTDGYDAAARLYGNRYADYLRDHDRELAAKDLPLAPWPLSLQGNDGI